MSLIIPKSQMTEEDIKLQFITPALQAKWPLNLITMETKITDGRINLQGNKVSREKAKKADYILYINAGNPIAVVEAKDNNHSVSFGLQQAVTYAKMLDVKFAYSSNGDGFEELDLITGEERTIGMDEFPTPDELFERYKSEMAITPAEELAIKQPYYSSATLYPPRYYQRVAVNRTVDAIAKGQDRLLLVMATGTGKTYTAFQIVYRLLQSDMKQKILYLADRNNLVDQTISGDFSPLEKVIHKINFNKDDKTTITSHQVYFSLYQQLAGNKNEEDDENADEVVARYSKLFSPDFFDLIIVDECHRGSAKENSRWRAILEYFNSATQIGMTATPKETDTKQFPYMLCITNMLLHDLDVPKIYHDNSLTRDLLDYTDDDKFDVILMNPPYGGSEKTEVKNHFPADLASSETADLFMAVIMYRLKKNGRAAVILPDGFLFGTDNAKVNLKKKLLNEFNLHTVIRMPGSVFSPYTSITTNILFFDNTHPTEETWFYRLDMPEGYKHFSKTKPMKVEHFAPVAEWWNDRKELTVDGFDKAKKFTAAELAEELGYNFDQCGYPHEEEEILDPLDLIQRYEEQRASLNAEIDRVLAEITAKLGGNKDEQ